MRLPWIFGSRPRGRHARRGQHHSSSLLRVRQLERRRVLDAAGQSLVVGPTIESGQESTVTSSVTTADPLVFDWAAATDPGTESAAAVQDFVNSVLAGGSNVAHAFGANSLPGINAANPQIVDEGSTLDLSADPGNDALAFVADFDLGDDHIAYVDWGDGSGFVPATKVDAQVVDGLLVVTFGGTHVYADGNDTHTVRVRVADQTMAAYSDPTKFANDAGENVEWVGDNFQVTVNNVAPTLTISGDTNVLENNPYTLNLSSADPGLDTITSWEINWGDGDVDIVPGNPASVMHTYEDGDAQYTITATATDEDGTFAANNLLVTVDNGAPTVTAVNLNKTELDEGDSLTVSGTFSDPALGVSSETFTVVIDWGNGESTMAIVDSAAGTYTADYTYRDDHPLTGTLQDVLSITVTVTDDDGDSGSSTADPGLARTVTVRNVAPVITDVVLSSMMLNEGQSLTVSGTFTDPAMTALTENFTITVDWGNGNNSLATVNQAAGTYTATYLYPDDHPTSGTAQDTFSIKVTITDDDLGSFSTPADGSQVTIKNVVPTIIASISTVTLDEGDALTISGTFDDAAIDVPTELFAAYVNWGDGHAEVVAVSVVAGVGLVLQTPHTYADDGKYTARVRLADDDMGAYGDPTKFQTGVLGVDFVEQTFTVTVNNVKPDLTVTPSSPTSISEGGSVSFGATFSDDGFDNPLNTNPTEGPAIGDPLAETFRYYVEWGDGRDTVPSTPVADINGGPGVPSTGSFNGSHTYADDGTYTVRVRIADDNMTGNFTSGVVGVDFVEKTFTVTVGNVKPDLTVTPSSPTSIDEGGTVTFGATFSDDGFDNPLNTNPTQGPAIGNPLAESFRYYVEWGDGRDTVPSTNIADINGGPGVKSTGAFNGSHVYADDGTYTVRVRIADDNMTGNFTGGVVGVDFVEKTFTVTVGNVKPDLTVTPSSPTSIDEGGTVSFGATFSDDGFDNPLNTNPTQGPAIGNPLAESFRYYVEWGDGRDTVPSTNVADINGGPGVKTTGSFNGSHTYADDGMYTVRVRIADDNMTGNFVGGVAGVDFVEKTFTVTVSNVKPDLTVTPSSPTSIDEGGSVSFGATFSDDGFDNPLNTNPTSPPALGNQFAESFRYYVEWGDGRDTVPSTNVADINGGPGVESTGSFNGSHVYADDGTYTIRVRIADDNMTGNFAGGVAGVDFVEKTFTVMVGNLKPDLTVTPSPTSINEGQTVSFGATFTDDGFDNPLNTNPTQGPAIGNPLAESFRYYVEWGDGRDTVPSANVADIDGGPGVKSTGTFNGSHTYADDGTYTVKVRIADDNMTGNFTGGVAGVDFVEKTFTVTVSNVKPDLTVTPSPTSINEGGTVTFGAALSDDGFDNPLNANPTQGPAIGDPLAESFRYYVEWGDGRDTVPSTNVTDINGGPGVKSTGLFNGSHTYADDGTYTVKVRIADDNMTGNFTGGVAGVDFVEKTFTVTVNNVKPDLTVTPSPTSINEGGTVTFGAAFSDDGFDNPLNTSPTQGPAIGNPLAESFRYYVEWGDGRDTVPSTNVADINGGPGVKSTGTFNGSHTYADDGTYTVKVRIADDNMTGNFNGVAGVDFVEKTFTVTVSNVKPDLTVTPTTAISISEGGTVSFDAAFTDNGFDNPLNTNPTQGPAIGDPLAETFRYHINWGDGRDTVANKDITNDTPGGPGVKSTGSFAGIHVYADDGTYTVKVRIADDNMTGNFNGVAGVDFVEKTFTVTVSNVAPSLTGTAGRTVFEGDAFTLNALQVGLEDPGFDNSLNPTVPAFGDPKRESFTSFQINWGDGAGFTTPVSIGSRTSGAPGVTTTATFDHPAYTYADDGTYTVTVRVADDNMSGNFSGTPGVDFVDLTFTILVKNVVPDLSVDSVTSSPDNVDSDPFTVNESGSVTFTASFSDVGFDNPINPNAAVDPLIKTPKEESFRYFIDWGDGRDQVGTMSVSDINGKAGTRSTGTFGDTHNYADDGVYTVRVRIADDNMLAFVDASMFGFNEEGGDQGEAGVDFIETTFTVTVKNTNPEFKPPGNGSAFQGDDITSEGTTIIRVQYKDLGYDNPANRNAPVLPNISNPKYELFTHLLDWGDGSVDAIHTYAVPGNYTVSVSVAGAELNGAFSFSNFVGSTSSVLTLVSGQTLNVGGETAYTYVVDWGDGTIQTMTLDLKAPLAPVAGNGLTTVMTALRTSGNANLETSGAFEVQHTYLGPPDPLHPTEDIRITVTVVDDNNATDSAFIDVPNPGIDVVNQRIDTTPQIPRLDFPTPPAIQALLNQGTGTIQTLQTADVGAGGGETGAASKRFLELVAYAPDGSVIDRYELKEEELADLRALFAKLPDGQYQIFLVRTDTKAKRLVMDVYVRRGQLIDIADDSEGTRDRPPTSESEENPDGVIEENAAADEAADGDAVRLPNDVPVGVPQSFNFGVPADVLVPSPQPPAPNYNSLRWGSSLAGLVLLGSGSRWSRKVDAALAQADHRAWQRLRRAGRLGGARSQEKRPTADVGSQVK